METTQVVLHTNLIKILFWDHEKTPTSNKYKNKNALLVEKIMRTHPIKIHPCIKDFSGSKSKNMPSHQNVQPYCHLWWTFSGRHGRPVHTSCTRQKRGSLISNEHTLGDTLFDFLRSWKKQEADCCLIHCPYDTNASGRLIGLQTGLDKSFSTLVVTWAI